MFSTLECTHEPDARHAISGRNAWVSRFQVDSGLLTVSLSIERVDQTGYSGVTCSAGAQPCYVIQAKLYSRHVLRRWRIAPITGDREWDNPHELTE